MQNVNSVEVCSMRFCNDEYGNCCSCLAVAEHNLGATVCFILQIRKQPKEVQMQRQQQAAEANKLQKKEQQEQNEAKKKMKGKNKPSRRHRKKQENIIEEKKGQIKQSMQEQKALDAETKDQSPENVPAALQRFYKRS